MAHQQFGITARGQDLTQDLVGLSEAGPLDASPGQPMAQQVARARRAQAGQSGTIETTLDFGICRVEFSQFAQQLGAFGEMRNGAGDPPPVGRIARLDTRQDGRAQVIASEPGVGIALVFAEVDRVRGGIVAQIRALDLEQRAQQASSRGQPPFSRHRRQTVNPGAAQQPQKKGLDLIVALMRQHDGIILDPIEGGIARATCGSLQALTGFLHRHPLDAERHRQTRALPSAMVGPRIGLRRKTMMDMEGAQGKPQGLTQAGEDMEKHAGVETAGKAEAETRTSVQAIGEKDPDTRLNRRGLP